MEKSGKCRNGRAGWMCAGAGLTRAGWIACVLGCMVPALLWGDETTTAERAFTDAQTVDDVIDGDMAVRIAAPANTFVAFTGANAYSGGTVIETGGVIVSNVTALGTGPIKCASGTAIRVCVDFAGHEGGLQELIDRIEVAAPAEGEAEPWVSFQLMEGGLANDVDFSKQPYLWLGAPGTGNKTQPFRGALVPYGNEYRFGYARSAYNEGRGLEFSSVLTDAPDGTPRRVLLRGNGVTTLSGGSYTGGIVVEGPAFLSLGGAYALGATTNLTVRDGAYVNFKNRNMTYPANLEIRNEGTNAFHSCGDGSMAVCTVFEGPITGWGKIRLTDQGGVRFTSASNTFTGTLELANDHKTYGIEIGIGDGANCSWKGDRIIQKNTTSGQNPSALTNNFVQVNCNDDFTLETDLGAPGGQLVKKGTGTLTLAKPFARTPRRADQPVIEIHEGTLRLTALEPTAATGLILFRGGATLDLNGVAATSLWLPYGAGSIVNPADGTMVLEGPANAQTAFNGTLAGDVTVRVTGSDPWQVGDRTHIAGKLALASGALRVNQGFAVDALDVDARARLLFNSDLPTDIGLKMEIWCNGNDKTWSGGDHAAKFATACAEMEKRKPDVTGDMADFLDGTFASGADPNTAPTPNAFTAALGSGPNNFIARFTGYFHAEVEGTYAFRVYADDAGRLTLDGTNRVANVAAGTKDAAGEGSAWLDAGWHPIEVLFNEEGGWEYVRVEMKAPGATAFEVMPLRLLSTWNEKATHLPRVTGAGTLELMPGAVWPAEMGLADFTGVLAVNDRTAEPDVGTVTPATALLSYAGTGALAHDWSPKGLAAYEAGNVATLCGKKDNWGSLNTTARIPLDKPFEVAFDFSAVQPWGSSLGDGFALVLHDGKVGYHGGQFSHSSTKRINETSAYGMQFYLMPDMTIFCWIRDNGALGSVMTNVAAKAFKMDNLRNSPMRVALAWDGGKYLVTTLEKGTARWCSTNAFAAADLPARFPDGAYLGIWAQNGGYYTAERIEKLSLVHGGMSDTAPKQVFNGTLGLTNGTVTAALAGSVQAELAADLAVTGAGTLTVEDGQTLACTGATWSFDLANPEAKLTCRGALTFPTATVTVDVAAGEATPRTRVLADLTGVAGDAAKGLSFRLAEDLPSGWRLRYRDGLLSLTDGTGTMLILR